MLHTLSLLHKHTHADVTHNISAVTHTHSDVTDTQSQICSVWLHTVLDIIWLHEMITHSNQHRQKENLLGQFTLCHRTEPGFTGESGARWNFPSLFQKWGGSIGSALCFSLSMWFVLWFLFWAVFCLLAFRSSEPSLMLIQVLLIIFLISRWSPFISVLRD